MVELQCSERKLTRLAGMTDDELELRALEAYVARFEADPNAPDKCARELDLRDVLAGLTGESGSRLDALAEVWLRRLAPVAAGNRPGPLRRCSHSVRNQAEHRFHLRAFQSDSGSPAWDRIRELKRDVPVSRQAVQGVQMAQSRIRVFISHASQDVPVAKALIELLRAALNLEAKAIRCTSVNGFRLPAGADTNEQLRIEVHDSDTFIGIVSDKSLRSLYVLFELGARWGARKTLIPLLAPGTPTSVLGGPLAGLNALRADDRSQVIQLIHDLAEVLSITPESGAVYQEQLDAVLAVPSSPLVHDEPPTREVNGALSFEDRSVVATLGAAAKELLLEASRDSNGTILFFSGGIEVQTNNRSFVERGKPRSEAKWRQAVSELRDAGLIEDAGSGEVFMVTDAGFRLADLLEPQL
jgi:hypothetical protein